MNKTIRNIVAATAVLIGVSACDVVPQVVQQAIPADNKQVVAEAPTTTVAPTLSTLPSPGPVGTVLYEGDTFGVIIGDTSSGWEDRCRDILHGSPTFVARGVVIPVLPGEGWDIIPFCTGATSTG